MKHIEEHFKNVDPILFAAIQSDAWHTRTRTHDYFAGMCRIVIGQQVSTKAAAAIYTKFANLFPRKKPTIQRVLTLSDEELRHAGLSRSKAASIRDIAALITEKSIVLKNLSALSDTEIIDMLTRARGIGPWSAEMFLIFYLGREDVFSSGDYGLRMAIKRLYKKRALPTPEAAKRLSKKWAPYRSYACRILWESLNNTPADS